jgi:hypothetical protein
MTRLSLAFYGRATASNPIVLKSPRRIERDAKWGAWKMRVCWLLCGLLVAASVATLIVCAG